MRNMDGILDGARLSRKRRHVDEEETFSQSVSIDRFEDSVAVKRVKDIKGIELEILGWDLLFAIRDAQLGQDSIPAWSKDWERKRYDSFMDRFNEVVLSLTKAKTVVSSLLNVGFMKRLAAAPERELHRKKDNKRLNLDRDISVKAGNYARKQGLVNVNQDNGIKAANGR
ncbi:hypothetical protein UCRPA7_695 [Phaeoacremonium minimum UCRPA7]|uniref:Uncharacterized protein n=1 Tax=Phaeoacremonium minimum (strain UCR-PA7) TaxID=1286976 RepID=R8BWW2_PHAM7|nr:hypothetical protein UCRPA7_695 [Phaeoacremonium minimum UCRPA7]EOO03851.1 hypothetical protein UCRPA7_695 [Phaeoacremonium minimum UCRPA7]